MPVSRRKFLAGSLALPAFAAKKKAAAPERPNIVLLMADNVPDWVLGTYGNKDIHTPNIDRLAQMGLRFQNHITASPAPQAGRTALLSGRMSPEPTSALEPLLAAAGYTCHTADAAAAAQFLEPASAGKPFFLTVNLKGPTAPYADIPSKYAELYAAAKFDTFSREPAAANAAAGKEMLADVTGSLRKYAAALTAMDADLQTVVAKVYERKLSDHTLIVFASTCGALLGRHGLWDAGEGSQPPNMYEESVKTPMIWSWPGRVPAMGERPEVVSSCDFLPTLCDLTGAAAPAGLGGASYLLLATGKPLPKKQRWKTTVFAALGNTALARADRYKLVQRDGGKGPGELYDLVADPVEAANQYDNPQYLTVRQGLSGELAAWRR
jgi:arylsulfatase A-like enzyme